jgi:hypothetical protein
MFLPADVMDYVTHSLLQLFWLPAAHSVVFSIPTTLSLLGPYIPNTLTLCSSLNVSGQVSHPYKTSGKITLGSCFATVHFTTIHFYNPCWVEPSTADLWRITVAT